MKTEGQILDIISLEGENMKIIDMHVDTLMKLMYLQKEGKEINLRKNDLNLDLTRLKKSNYIGQIFACYVDLGKEALTGDHYGDAIKMIEIYKDQLAENQDLIAPASDYKSYLKNKEKGLISGFLAIEEGGIIGKDLEKLDELYELGVRFITLTWNYENEIGYPNFKARHQNDGLKPFGREVLEKMDYLGIVADASHLSDGGFNDLVKYGKRPFLATHSNSRRVQNHLRNLTDDMLKALANKGGITGLNFCDMFLDGDKSTVESMIRHIKHIVNVGGEDVIALGTDFDGIGEENLELKGVQDTPKLIEAMERAGLKPEVIEKFAYKNFEEFLKRFEA